MEITEEMKMIVRRINKLIDNGETDLLYLYYELYKLVEDAMEEEEPIRL
tara:strand:- start:57 stop:203 length:147 start_codon:yes stop_codon:yes gene_type:complete